MFEKLEIKEWLELNAKLQQKKNALRNDLREKGTLTKSGKNNYDNYTYFSEAQYKELFTELFSKNKLELKFNELEYEMFETTSKSQTNGRLVKIEFSLFDTETGFVEKSIITGEGIDKGDKAGYQAYTGALKYYLADTFMVATGDDPEKESPEAKGNNRSKKPADPNKKASPNQIAVLSKAYTGDNLAKLLQINGISTLEEITQEKASELISQIYSKKKEG